MAQKHADPPVSHRVHGQIPVEDSDLKDGHPAKQTDFEEQERKRISFQGAVDDLRTVLVLHGRDREVPEDDAERERESEVNEELGPEGAWW